jgi:hypothetical protein
LVDGQQLCEWKKFFVVQTEGLDLFIGSVNAIAGTRREFRGSDFVEERQKVVGVCGKSY